MSSPIEDEIGVLRQLLTHYIWYREEGMDELAGDVAIGITAAIDKIRNIWSAEMKRKGLI